MGFLFIYGLLNERSTGLLLIRSDQHAYGMHKLVHAWSHDRVNGAQRREWSSAVLELLADMIRDYWGNLAIEQRLVPHIMANLASVSFVRINSSDRRLRLKCDIDSRRPASSTLSR